MRALPYQQLVKEVCGALQLPSGGRLLDAGCGTGNLLVSTNRFLQLSEGLGLDASEAMLKRARKKIKGCSNLAVQQSDLNLILPIAKDYFDGAVCINVLYCMKNPLFALSQIGRFLKTGGSLVLVTPPARPRLAPLFSGHAGALKKEYRALWPFVFIAHFLYLLPFMPLFLIINLFIKGHGTFHFFEREELLALARQAGFAVEELKKTYAGQGWLLVGRKNVS